MYKWIFFPVAVICRFPNMNYQLLWLLAQDQVRKYSTVNLEGIPQALVIAENLLSVDSSLRRVTFL